MMHTTTFHLLLCVMLVAMLGSALSRAEPANPEERTLTEPKAMASEARAAIEEIEPEALHALLLQKKDPPLIVDVRTEREYLAGHLRGATWVPRGKLEFAIGKLEDEADGNIVLYCRTGERAALAANTLQKMGYTHVLSLEGGFRQWVEDDYSIYNQHGEIRVVEFEADEAE